SFIDEIAYASEQDPLVLRQMLLAEHPRHLQVLALAAKKSQWGTSLPEGYGRGIAIEHCMGSYVAQVVEVSVGNDKSIRIHRVTCVVDCGIAVNPLNIKAQMEGAIVFGLSAALHGEITIEGGAIQQSNFHDYPVLRINEMPEIEVHIIKSGEKPSGVGEPGVPPVAPAVANAVFAATGMRVRKLPIRL
ncbi:molybdopterin-dependent oxidoreductase, partial [Porticoccaceae bacterium]|nr:molybdopterin-dependent oxidoreductase [Porticoccaceae bacterium]